MLVPARRIPCLSACLGLRNWPTAKASFLCRVAARQPWMSIWTRTHLHHVFQDPLALQIAVEKVDTAKFDDAYFKAAESKTKGSKKKTEDGFFNEVRAACEKQVACQQGVYAATNWSVQGFVLS